MSSSSMDVPWWGWVIAVAVVCAVILAAILSGRAYSAAKREKRSINYDAKAFPFPSKQK